MDANRLMVIKSLFSHRPTFARQIICSSLQNFGSTTSLMSIFLHSDDLLNPEGDGRDGCQYDHQCSEDTTVSSRFSAGIREGKAAQGSRAWIRREQLRR